MTECSLGLGAIIDPGIQIGVWRGGGNLNRQTTAVERPCKQQLPHVFFVYDHYIFCTHWAPPSAMSIRSIKVPLAQAVEQAERVEKLDSTQGRCRVANQRTVRREPFGRRHRRWGTRLGEGEKVEGRTCVSTVGPLTTSDGRDSNPRPRPWQGRALPAELPSR